MKALPGAGAGLGHKGLRWAVAALLLSPLAAWATTNVSVAFAPNPVAPGGASTLSFTFANSGSAATSFSGPAATFSLPAGVQVASAPALSDGCGFSGNSVSAGATSFAIGGAGAVPGNNGSCTVSFAVKAQPTAGTNADLVIAQGAFAGASDASTVPSTSATATLSTSQFANITINNSGTVLPGALPDSNGGSVLSPAAAQRTLVLNLNNPNLVPIDITSFKVGSIGVTAGSGAGEVLSTTCSSAVSIDPSSGTPVLTGGQIPASGSCSLSFSVRQDSTATSGNVQWASYFSIPVGSLTSAQGATNSQYNGGVFMRRGVEFIKSLSPSAIGLDGNVTMTLTVRSGESYAADYSVTDPMPMGLEYVGSSVAPAACAGAPPAPTGANGGSFTFAGTVPASQGDADYASSTCTWTIQLKSRDPGFAGAPVPQNQVQVVTNTLGAATVAPPVGGTQPQVIQTAGSSSIAITNCEQSSCQLGLLGVVQSFTTMSSAGTPIVVNSTDASPVAQIASGSDGYFTYTLTAGAEAVNALQFAAKLGGGGAVATPTSYLAAATNSCGGTLAVAPGATTVSLSGGALAANASCTITVPVHYSGANNTASISSVDISQTYGQSASGVAATAGTPSIAGNYVQNSFVNTAAVPNLIAAGATTQLTVTPQKSQATNQIGNRPTSNGTYFLDLRGGSESGRNPNISFAVVGMVSSAACGSAVQVQGWDPATGVSGTTGPIGAANTLPGLKISGFQTPDGTAAALAGYTASATQLMDPNAYKPAQCNVVVTIKELGNDTGSYRAIVTGSNWSDAPAGGDKSNYMGYLASLEVQVVPPQPMALTKSFTPNPAAAGQVVAMTVTLPNNSGNAVPLSNIAFTDNYPPGLSNSATPNATMAAAAGATCAGVGTGTLTADAGGQALSWSGGAMNAGDVCQVTVNVIPSLSGVTNTLWAANGNGHTIALSNDQGVVPQADVAATLLATPSIGVTKQFSPDTILSGETSTLKILLTNFYATATDAGSLQLTDTLPAGVTAVANSAVDVNSCGISTAIAPGSVALTGGSIPAGGSCEIDVTVTSVAPSQTAYQNTIGVGAMTAKVGGSPASNGIETSAPLTVNPPPALTINKTVSGSPSTGLNASFAFTTVCTKDGNAVSGSPFSSTITVASPATTGSASVNGIPVGSNCKVSETPPQAAGAPTNYQWGATPQDVSVKTTSAGVSAPFTNPLTRLTGTLTISKTVSGGPATGLNATFAFTAVCTDTDNSTISGSPFSASITVASPATGGSATVSGIPAGASCVVSETAPAASSAPANYQWGATPAAVTVAMKSSGAAAPFTNTLTRITRDLVINKTVSGGPATGLNATFTFTTTCSDGSNAVSGSPFTSTVSVASPATTGSATVKAIPAGAACAVKETAPTAASAPAGYQWGALPAAVSVTISATDANAAAVTNLLAKVAAPTPVPANALWALLAAAAGLLAYAAQAMRARR